MEKLFSVPCALVFTLAFFIHQVKATPRQLFSTEPRAVVTKKEISFSSGGFTLKGTIITAAPEGKKVPAIIFSVGSGESSYTTNYKKFLEEFFDRNLPLDSVALLYFDKRGFGASEGKWYKTTLEERADDVKAAADYLKTLSFIDPSKIAIAGHSQGGWIAQIAMARFPGTFSAGISMAGPNFGVKKQLINDYSSKIISSKNISKENAIKKATKKANTDIKLASTFPVKPKWKQLKMIKHFEPASYLISIKNPMLFVYAENDALVYPEWCLQELNEIFKNRIPAHFETVTVKGADHDFLMNDLCPVQHKMQYAEEVKTIILTWARKYLF